MNFPRSSQKSSSQKSLSHKASSWTIIRVLAWTSDYFRKHGIESPRLTAEILLANALGLERIDLYIRHDQPLKSSELAVFRRMIKRRACHEPVDYIIESKEFFGRNFFVCPHVLIPRPETEILVETAVDLLASYPDHGRVLDIGTGSGVIAVTLAKEMPAFSYLASDISVKALSVAGKNAVLHDVEDKISFFAGDLLMALSPGFRACLIVSNPPYIPSEQIPLLAPEIAAHEPIIALDGSYDGLSVIRRIIESAPDFLCEGGHLLLEIGHDQKQAVERLAGDTGRYARISFVRDLAGIDRVAVLQK